ncbi:winged helix-turn-helix domain-containing protein [Streptomyces filamentosus]|uniref:winged helix-turn-helix domain-containing protein n=1 Tax=Streptomyces filamentosus TaxID=67294 RepID=UPI0033FBE084
MAARKRRLVLVDEETGEVVDPKPRVPHDFEGRGYTLQSIGAEVPLYKLKLAGTEWDTLEWLREHGGANSYVRTTPKDLAEEINANESTCKKALSRLTSLGLLLKPSPRAAAYQLTPLRYWEGAGSTQVTATKRLAPPRIAPDDKAKARTAPRIAEPPAATPLRRAAGETS